MLAIHACRLESDAVAEAYGAFDESDFSDEENPLGDGDQYRPKVIAPSSRHPAQNARRAWAAWLCLNLHSECCNNDCLHPIPLAFVNFGIWTSLWMLGQ